MTLARKNAMLSSSVWLVIAVLFAAIFFTTGPSNFHLETSRGSRILVAAVILPGYLLNTLLLFRSQRGRKNGELDERDEALALKASQFTLTALAVLGFSACIALYEIFQATGSVPVGWLYFLAYGTMVLVSLLHGMGALWLDYRGNFNG